MQGATNMQIISILLGLLLLVGLLAGGVVLIRWIIKVVKRIPLLHDFDIECSPRNY